VQKTTWLILGYMGASRLIADAPVANTEITRSTWLASSRARSRGSICRRAAASVRSASRPPFRSEAKWNASNTPGSAIIDRNTALPIEPPPRPSNRIRSRVLVDQPSASSVAEHASASVSWPMPIDPESSSARRPRE
jgi:hypothetical protein